MRIGKVFKNINDSNLSFPYKRFNFIFSSQFYFNKFEREINKFIENENFHISKRYSIMLEANEYLALVLYKKIEKRGFRVYFDNKLIKENQTFTVDPSFILERR